MLDATVLAGHEASDAPASVSTFEELEAWLQENRHGGRIRLDADIYVSEDELHLSSRSNERLIIETGPYQIIVSGSLYLAARTDVIGDGTKPVIEMLAGSHFYLRDISYNSRPSITATKDYGCALSFLSGSSYHSDLTAAMDITATGHQADAIRSQIPLTLEQVFIEAKGSGSVGIASTESVEMIFCEVFADSKSIIASSVTADTCNISPVPEKIVKKLERNISKIVPSVPLSFHTGSQEPLLLDGVSLRTTITLSAENETAVNKVIYVQYDAARPIDINVPGIYSYNCTLPAPYNRFILAEKPLTQDLTIIETVGSSMNSNNNNASSNHNAPSEYSSGTVFSISGQRLSAYLTENNQYTFICGPYRLSMTRKTLEAYCLSEQDIIKVEILSESSGILLVSIYINNISVTEDFAEPSILTLPCSDPSFRCYDEQGNELLCTYNEQNETVSVPILHPGMYKISANAAIKSSAAADTNIPRSRYQLIIILILSIIGASGLVLAVIICRKHVRGNLCETATK